jgi:hypothetical protein
MKPITKFQNLRVLISEFCVDVAKVNVPVGSSGQRDALCANREREDLTNHHPRGRAPGGGEEEDVEAGEDDEADGRRLAALVHGADDSDDELADEHAYCSVDKEHAATEPLDSPEGKWCRANIDSGGDHGNDESVLEADRLEESGTIVKDCGGCQHES